MRRSMTTTSRVHPRFNAMTISMTLTIVPCWPLSGQSIIIQAILEEAKAQPVVRHLLLASPQTPLGGRRPSQVAGVEDFKRYYQSAYIQQRGADKRACRKLPQGLFAYLGFIQSQVRLVYTAISKK